MAAVNNLHADVMVCSILVASTMFPPCCTFIMAASVPHTKLGDMEVADPLRHYRVGIHPHSGNLAIRRHHALQEASMSWIHAERAVDARSGGPDREERF